jgi:hypothetical protein
MTLLTHKERFLAFHHENPQVYKELVRLARQAKARGRNRLGIRMLWEVMRWNLTIVTVDPNSEFKLNDHYHSRYARRIMKKEDDLTGIFAIRELKTVGR